MALRRNTLVRANGGEMEAKGRKFMKGIVLEMNPNHNYKVEWEDGNVWRNVALSSLENLGVNYEVGTDVYVTIGTSKLKAVVEEMCKFSETLKVNLCGQTLKVKKVDVISVEDEDRESEHETEASFIREDIISEEIEIVPEEEVTPSEEEDSIKYPYSSKVLLNPAHTLIIGSSKVDYTISNNRLQLRVYGERVDLEELLKVLVKDTDFMTSVEKLSHKSPYKMVETVNEEEVHFIKRHFLNVNNGMTKQESLGLRFKKSQDETVTLYGYQKTYILDFMMALESLGLATKDGDGYTIEAPIDYSKEALESDGWTVPESYNS